MNGTEALLKTGWFIYRKRVIMAWWHVLSIKFLLMESDELEELNDFCSIMQMGKIQFYQFKFCLVERQINISKIPDKKL